MADSKNLARPNAFDRRQCWRHQRQQIFEGVACSAQYHSAQASPREILLKLEIQVTGQEDLESGSFGFVQKRAVLQTRP